MLASGTITFQRSQDFSLQSRHLWDIARKLESFTNTWTCPPRIVRERDQHEFNRDITIDSAQHSVIFLNGKINNLFQFDCCSSTEWDIGLRWRQESCWSWEESDTKRKIFHSVEFPQSVAMIGKTGQQWQPTTGKRETYFGISVILNCREALGECCQRCLRGVIVTFVLCVVPYWQSNFITWKHSGLFLSLLLTYLLSWFVCCQISLFWKCVGHLCPATSQFFCCRQQNWSKTLRNASPHQQFDPGRTSTDFHCKQSKKKKHSEHLLSHRGSPSSPWSCWTRPQPETANLRFCALRCKGEVVICLANIHTTTFLAPNEQIDGFSTMHQAETWSSLSHFAASVKMPQKYHKFVLWRDKCCLLVVDTSLGGVYLCLISEPLRLILLTFKVGVQISTPNYKQIWNFPELSPALKSSTPRERFVQVLFPVSRHGFSVITQGPSKSNRSQATEIKAPGSICQKYVYTSFIVQISFKFGYFQSFWICMGEG